MFSGFHELFDTYVQSFFDPASSTLLGEDLLAFCQSWNTGEGEVKAVCLVFPCFLSRLKFPVVRLFLSDLQNGSSGFTVTLSLLLFYFPIFHISFVERLYLFSTWAFKSLFTIR